MASIQSVQWTLTLKALKDLEGDLMCNKCCKLVVSPKTFRNCLHFFCQTCIRNSINCPVCQVPSSAKDIYHDEFIENLAKYVENIEKSLRYQKVRNKCGLHAKGNFDMPAKNVSKPVDEEKNSNFTLNRQGHASPEKLELENDVKTVKGSKRKLGQRRNVPLSKKISTDSLKSSFSGFTQNMDVFSFSGESFLQTPKSSDDTQRQISIPSPSDANAPLSSDLGASVILPGGNISSRKTKGNAKPVPKVTEVKARESSNPDFITPLKNLKGKKSGEALIKSVSDTVKKAANKRNAKGETPLQVACKKGNLKQVQSLIADRANPNVKDNFGWTPLHEAIHYNHMEIAKELIEKGGASVNTPGGENCTPLHKAVAVNMLEGIKFLLKYGADPNLVDIYGNIPVEYSQSDEVARMLESHTAHFAKYSILGSLSEELELDEERAVFFGDGLSKSDLKLLMNLSSLIPGSRVSHSFASDVTHVVVNEENGTCLASVNVLHGILTGKNFVSMNWVQDSIDMKSIKHQNSNAVKSTKSYPYGNGILRARVCLRKLLPSIFSGMHFAISSVCRNLKYDNLKKDDIANLVALGNGQYHSREPDPEAIPIHEKTVPFYANNFVEELTGLNEDHPLKNCSHVILYQDDDHKSMTQRGDPSFIKYNMAHFKSLPITWFVGCIESFTLLDPSPFL